jgi:hypothetical protein
MYYNRTALAFEKTTSTSNYIYYKNMGVNTSYVSKEDIDSYLLKLEDDNFKAELNLKCENDFKEEEIYPEYNLTDFICNKEMNRTTITEKYNGSDKINILINRNYDVLEKIYLHIEFNNEITNKDIFKLLEIELEFTIGGLTIFRSHIIFSFIIALVKGINIFPEINVLRLPIYDFTDHSDCLPIISLQHHDCKFILKNITKHFSSAKLFEFKLVSKYQSNNSRRRLAQNFHAHNIWTNQRWTEYVKHNVPFELKANLLIQCILFYYDVEDHDFDSYIESISFNANHTDWLTFEQDELIIMHIYNFKIYIICLDPKYKNENMFNKQFRTYNDQKDIIGVNFSRLDNIECKINFSDSVIGKKIHIDFMSLNQLRIAYGMAGLSLSN